MEEDSGGVVIKEIARFFATVSMAVAICLTIICAAPGWVGIKYYDDSIRAVATETIRHKEELGQHRHAMLKFVEAVKLTALGCHQIGKELDNHIKETSGVSQYKPGSKSAPCKPKTGKELGADWYIEKR